MKLRNAPLVIGLHLVVLALTLLALAAANVKALFLTSLVMVPMLIWHTWRLFAQNNPLDMDVADSEAPEGVFAVDPWEYQRVLMEMSGQRIMSRPTLTKEAVLYGALVMEESGETFIGLWRAMSHMVEAREAHGLSTTGMQDVAFMFQSRGSRCMDDSRWIRQQLALIDQVHGRFDIELPQDIAVEILDGATDVVVVTAGLAHAAGLPGAAGYAEVVGSNMSKAQPDTGKIDKTDDGKWIKGPNYVQPDLARVLAEHAA